MFPIAAKLNTISHPLISSMHVKMNPGARDEKVLVIETRFPGPDKDCKKFDACLMDLLLDLGHLKSQAEKNIGFLFDRVDIRTH